MKASDLLRRHLPASALLQRHGPGAPVPLGERGEPLCWPPALVAAIEAARGHGWEPARGYPVPSISQGGPAGEVVLCIERGQLCTASHRQLWVSWWPGARPASGLVPAQAAWWIMEAQGMPGGQLAGLPSRSVALESEADAVAELSRRVAR